MYRHTIQIPDEKQFPINDWKIIETDYDEQKLGQRETIFATGNGYIGMRGNYAEGRPVFQSGTFINGFYESWPIVYGEEAYGFAGMRDYDGALTFNPKMHPNWEQLKFPLTYQGQMLEVDIRRDTVIYLLTEGSGLTIKHKDRDIALSPGEPVTISLNE
jgi:alpha,alpha-trehalose phosphorylase